MKTYCYTCSQAEVFFVHVPFSKTCRGEDMPRPQTQGNPSPC